MRDTVGSSVGATVRDSMLKPRAENSPDTLDRAPASFSINNDNIWRMLDTQASSRSWDRCISLWGLPAAIMG